MPFELRICLPWPAKELFPNARIHWAKRSRAVKTARSLAFYHAFDSHRPKPSDNLCISLEFVPPDNRGRDLDNMVAAMKSSIDGIAQALNVNDRHFSFGSITRAKAEKPGCVIITISEQRRQA